MRLIEDDEEKCLVTIFTGIDYTAAMMKWIAEKLIEIEKEHLCGFIFKSKSPSSAIVDAEIYSPSGTKIRRGAGIFGGAFVQCFPLIPVIDDVRLHDPVLREDFLEKVFTFFTTLSSPS